MSHHQSYVPLYRIEDLLRRRRQGTRPPGRIAPPAEGRRRPGPPRDLPGRVRPTRQAEAPEATATPLVAGAEYRYRLGCHELILGLDGAPRPLVAAVAREEAAFGLAVEGPLLVLHYRFGAAIPWSQASPYNWHFTPAPERVVPPAIPLTPETYARLWATLWITLVERHEGRVRARRAVVLRPEFTHALNGALRAQASRPLRRGDADRALDRLRFAAHPHPPALRITTRCPAAWASPTKDSDAHDE